MDKVFTQAPKTMRKVSMGSIWMCYPSRTNHVFYAMSQEMWAIWKEVTI